MTGCTVNCLVLVRAKQWACSSVVCRELGVRKPWLQISESGSEDLWQHSSDIDLFPPEPW